MRISDWSSDVCSSDLITRRVRLPGIEIDLNGSIALDMLALLEHRRLVHDAPLPVDPVRPLPRLAVRDRPDAVAQSRSEERRVGKECVSPCSSRWSPYN